MFNSLFKTLLLRYGRNHTVRAASSTCNKFRHFHFQTSILVKNYVSTTTTSIPQSITQSHLMNSSGLSPESAFGVAKFSTYPESQENPVTVQAFFRKHGFFEAQISKVMEANPGALTAKPEETLLPKFEFFYSRGFSGPDIGQIFSGCPSLVNLSQEDHIIPTFNFLDDLFKFSEMKTAAVYVGLYVWPNWGDKFSCYISWGWSEEEVIAAFVKYAKFMKVSLNKIDEVVEFLVRKLRLEPSAIAKCPEVVELSVEKNFCS